MSLYHGDKYECQKKTKDTIKTQLDLQEMNIRSELHPIQRGKNLTFQKQATHILIKDKHKFVTILKESKIF